MTTKIDLNKAKEFVATWNIRAGNKPHTSCTPEWEQAVIKQGDVTLEEIIEVAGAAGGVVQEVQKDIAADTILNLISKGRTVKFNHLELLDGVVDSIYTLSQLITLLEDAGFDVAGAYKAVCDNNQQKLFTNKTIAQLALDELVQEGKEGLWLDCYVDEKSREWWTIKNENGKVCKYKNFPKVELEGFLPAFLPKNI